MKIGIVGFPGSGKSTIFNALTGQTEEPGAKPRERIGVIKVPDARIDSLAELCNSKKKVHAEITFIDAPVPPGAETGKGLDPTLIQAMRECEALVLVLRDFANPMLSEDPDPLGELDRFREELVLTDLMPLDNRREKLKKDAEKKQERELIAKVLERLEDGLPLMGMELADEERRLLSGFALLSGKPLLCLLNQEESAFASGLPEPVRAGAEAAGAEAAGLPLIAISAKIEQDIAGMPEAEQAEFLQDLGADTTARDRFIQASYAMLDLISFLTTGEDESRAWPIRRGTAAQKAAGKIHSDIERGFIRAEVIAYDALITAGGYKQARDTGQLRLEGKTYLVLDGDVINFRFNV